MIRFVFLLDRIADAVNPGQISFNTQRASFRMCARETRKTLVSKCIESAEVPNITSGGEGESYRNVGWGKSSYARVGIMLEATRCGLRIQTRLGGPGAAWTCAMGVPSIRVNQKLTGDWFHPYLAHILL